MKKILITLALVATTAASFAQGKILLGNDALHLITVGGTPVPQVGGWTGLTMQLMGGTSAGSMTLQTTIVGDAIGNATFNDGRINSSSLTLTGVGTTVSASLQLLFFPTSFGSYNAAAAVGAGGASPVFTVTTGSFAYNSIVLHGAPGNSTWADAPLAVVIPEPTSMVLAGLGAASLLLFRRRN